MYSSSDDVRIVDTIDDLSGDIPYLDVIFYVTATNSSNDVLLMEATDVDKTFEAYGDEIAQDIGYEVSYTVPKMFYFNSFEIRFAYKNTEF